MCTVIARRALTLDEAIPTLIRIIATCRVMNHPAENGAPSRGLFDIGINSPIHRAELSARSFMAGNKWILILVVQPDYKEANPACCVLCRG
jgi:hypothetical protein